MATYFHERGAEWGLNDEDYYTTPPTEWDRAEAWARAAGDAVLAEAVRLEPDLLKVLELARSSRRVATYKWSVRRESLRPLIDLYVGDTARLGALGTHRHWDTAMEAVDALLPRDRFDDEALLIERGADEVRAILHTRLILPTKPRPQVQDFGAILDELEGQLLTGDPEEQAQLASDRAWVAGLQITPDPVLTAPFASPS